MTPSDAQIIDSCAAVLRQARALCRDPSEADDIAQDTIEKILRFRPQVNDLQHLKRVMRQTCIWAWRSRGRHRQGVARKLKHFAASTFDAITLPAQYHATLLGEIAAMMPSLAGIHQEALLAKAEGLTHGEMAETWGCSEGTTKSRSSRARVALNELIGETGIE